MRFILLLSILLAFQSVAASNYEELLIRANTGNPVSQYELAEYIASAKIEIETNSPATNGLSNRTESIIWYRKSAEQGYVNAQYRLAQSLLAVNASSVGPNDTEALQWLMQASGKNHADAQVALANLYRVGVRIPSNATEAQRLYLSAANLGNVEAQYRVARLFENLGKSERSDSLSWYEKAGKSSESTANAAYWQGVSGYRLGEIYQTGKMVKKDLVEAFSWYNLAAHKRNSDAMAKLASMYEKGSGTTRDVSKSLMWHMIASSRGVSKSRKKVARLSKKLPLAEVKTISRLADKCRVKRYKNC